MTIERPTISVVVPTRDRPAFVRQALASLCAQELTDIEIVISDNAATAPCVDVAREYADDERVRYLTPPHPLSMNDNWEFACEAARGEYVGVVIDKTVWLPSTARIAMQVLERMPASVLTWWNSMYAPIDEGRSLDDGWYTQVGYPPHPPMYFDGREELERRLSFDVRRGGEGSQYYRGKLCFGLYRRDVLDAIRQRAGRVFPPISPDYTSRVLALATADSFVDVGAPLQLSFASQTSNGARAQREAPYARQFLAQIDADLAERLPVPGVYASQHNVVAHDYLLAAEYGDRAINMPNLMRRVREDLREVSVWESEEERRHQIELLRSAQRAHGRTSWAIVAEAASVRAAAVLGPARDAVISRRSRLLARFPGLRDRLKFLMGRPASPVVSSSGPIRVKSIWEASGLAEEYADGHWRGSARVSAPIGG